MTQHVFEVFKWSGYNQTYPTSSTAVIEDDDDSYEGSSDANEKISIDGGAFTDTMSVSLTLDLDFKDTDGVEHNETFYFMYTSDGWYFAPGPDSEFSPGASLGSYTSYAYGWDYDDVACFVSGTLIETAQGPKPVESLTSGTMLRLESGDLTPVRLCLNRDVSATELAAHPRLYPVRICAEALGNGLPRRDLLVSRQHRMLVRSPIARRMFGGEVLVPAIKFTALPGIFIDTRVSDVTYHHLLLDQHEIVLAEGAPSESFFASDQSVGRLGRVAQAELETLFPNLIPHNCRPARPIPPLPRQKRLIARQRKNAKPLITSM